MPLLLLHVLPLGCVRSFVRIQWKLFNGNAEHETRPYFPAMKKSNETPQPNNRISGGKKRGGVGDSRRSNETRSGKEGEEEHAATRKSFIAFSHQAYNTLPPYVAEHLVELGFTAGSSVGDAFLSEVPPR